MNALDGRWLQFDLPHEVTVRVPDLRIPFSKPFGNFRLQKWWGPFA